MTRRTQVCPDGPLTKGIDVSFWQGVIDWQALADAGVKFAFIRAGDGLGTDTQFRRNWAEAKRVGILRGAYVFFRARHSGEEQARVLLRNLGGDVGELPPVLDIEGKGGEGQTREKILLEMRRWIAVMREAVGRDPMIYTGSFWHFSIGSDEFSDLALWTADYSERTRSSGCPGVPGGWRRWTFWQTSSRGRLPGIRGNVDLDVFNGDEEALLDFAYGSTRLGKPRNWLTLIGVGVVLAAGAWWWLRRRPRGGKG